MDIWHRLGLVGLRLAYQHGQINPVALLAHLFDRIDQLNPRLNIMAQLDRDRALQAAHESAARYHADAHRPLEGVPIAVSSSIAVSGLDQWAGMEARRGLVAREDAPLVATLRNAGAIILGTLNMDEAGLGIDGNNPWTGRTYNPHGESHSPGGASGGCGAAVASGFCLAAIGGDALGGLRVPASLCGVYGLRPSAGALPIDGLVPLAPSFDNIGIAARAMDDVNGLATVLIAPDLDCALAPANFVTLERVEDLRLNEDVAAHYHYALSLLPERPDALALPMALPRLGKAARAFAERHLMEQLVALGEERCSRLSDPMARLVVRVLEQSEANYAEDCEVLRLAGQALRGQIAPGTLLMTPATPAPADMHGALMARALADLSILADVSGLPSIVIPVGRTGDNMPIALQLIGAQGTEALLITQGKMLSDRMRGYAPPEAWW